MAQKLRVSLGLTHAALGRTLSERLNALLLLQRMVPDIPCCLGEVMNLGADWAWRDTRNNSHPDTRYGLRTDDGVDIYIQTFGSKQADGVSHLHGLFETGSDKYWWLNDIVSVGILTSGGGPWVKIDMWYMKSPTNASG
jgi:hypothetical protein